MWTIRLVPYACYRVITSGNGKGGENHAQNASYFGSVHNVGWCDGRPGVRVHPRVHTGGPVRGQRPGGRQRDRRGTATTSTYRNAPGARRVPGAPEVAVAL